MVERGFTLFLAGDVMLGRGVDQILPRPCDPALAEPCILDAREYVALAEAISGAIPRGVPLAYPWGDALEELARARPDGRVVNLETSVTRSGAFDRGKLVSYRVSPENAASLRTAGLDVCTLANNHVLDFGLGGLVETIATLDALGIEHAGAGRTLEQAQAPAVIDRAELGRALVFAVGLPSAGVPRGWAARPDASGVWLEPEPGSAAVGRIAAAIAPHVRARDLVVLSLHWGPNWGYAPKAEERRFARALIDEAGVDVVHGHSSHHVRGIEVHRGRLILYGCGDLLTDYEGITGYERYRGELGLLYFAALDAASGRLLRLEMVPTRMRRLRVTRARGDDARWLAAALNREGAELGTRVELDPEDRIQLRLSSEP